MSGAGVRRVGLAVLVVIVAAGCTTTSGSDRAEIAVGRSGPSVRTRSRWTATLPSWAFAITADDDGAFVLAGDGDLLALDPADGRERWRAVAVRAFLYPPAIDRETVVLSARDRFVAFDRSSGRFRWEVPVVEAAGAATLAGAGDDALALVTTETGSVVALDARSGEARWSAHHPGKVFAPPVVDRGTGIAAVTWNDAVVPRLRALDLATGAVRWEVPIGVSSSAPIISRGTVVTGEGDARFSSRIVGRDPATGAERWSVTVPSSFEPSLIPGADGGEVAIADHFGNVTLLDARDGDVRWQVPIDEPVLRTRMHVTGRAVILTSHRGNVVVLDRDTGRVTERGYPGGYPAGTALAGGKLLLALRLTEPARVEARPAP